MKSLKQLGAGWMIISAFAFALMGVFVKKAGSHYHFIELVFWRGVFGIILMGIIGYSQKTTFKTPFPKQHLVRSIAGVVSMFAYFYAMVHLPIATATTLNYTSPIFMVFWSFIIMRHPISLLSMIGILIGFSGVLLLLQPNFASGTYKAVLIGLCSGIISAIAYIQIQQMTQLAEPEWRIVFYFSVVMCLLSTIILTLTKNWHGLSGASFIHIIGMGICATIAQLTMTKAYHDSNMFVVSACSYTTIIFSTIFGSWLLHDQLHLLELFAMLIIMCSGVITKLGTLKKI